MKKRLVKWFKILGVTYTVICVLLFVFQERVILRPEVLPRDHDYNFRFANEEVDIEMADGAIMNLVKFKAIDSVRKGIVLYFHGNKRNIDRYVYAVPMFSNRGYDVWMMDYPGFGKSTGKFSEERAYEWARKTYELALGEEAPYNIVLYGKSLGTAFASKIASENKCRMLILESPYYSLPSLLNNYLPIVPADLLVRSKFRNYEYLPRVDEQIVIFQGTDDWVVPYRNARRLSEYLKHGDRFISVKGAAHSNLRKHSQYLESMDSLLTNDH